MHSQWRGAGYLCESSYVTVVRAQSYSTGRVASSIRKSLQFGGAERCSRSGSQCVSRCDAMRGCGRTPAVSGPAAHALRGVRADARSQCRCGASRAKAIRSGASRRSGARALPLLKSVADARAIAKVTCSCSPPRPLTAHSVPRAARSGGGVLDAMLVQAWPSVLRTTCVGHACAGCYAER